MLYVGTYPQIYPPTILRLGIVSRDGLPRGILPSGILKLKKYCPGLKVLHSNWQLVHRIIYGSIAVKILVVPRDSLWSAKNTLLAKISKQQCN